MRWAPISHDSQRSVNLLILNIFSILGLEPPPPAWHRTLKHISAILPLYSDKLSYLSCLLHMLHTQREAFSAVPERPFSALVLACPFVQSCLHKSLADTAADHLATASTAAVL